MTDEQIEEFTKKIAAAKCLEIKSRELHFQASEEELNARQSCDHRQPNGNLAGPEFGGSYCGFDCQICGRSVSYEIMGY